MLAAHQIQKPITLLSFLAVDECIADVKEIKYVQTLFSRSKVKNPYNQSPGVSTHHQ
jgi:hypothetical protein